MAIELKKFQTKIQWQIDRRALIQRLLFDLHSFLNKHSEFWEAPDDYWHPMNRMVAIAFSLWRSAFLTDVTGERKTIQNHTKDFIEKVLKHNAITFADYHKMSELAMFYYNHNARYRLERMLLHDPSLEKLPSLKRICYLRGAGDIEKRDQQDLWDDLFLATHDCFDNFKRCWETEMGSA